MEQGSKKTYADGIYVKSVTTKYGDLLTADINVDRFINWLKVNVNERGYVRVNIPERKSVGQYGDTHSVVLNTFTPSEKKEKPQGPFSNDDKPVMQPSDKFENGDEDDNLPF